MRSSLPGIVLESHVSTSLFLVGNLMEFDFVVACFKVPDDAATTCLVALFQFHCGKRQVTLIWSLRSSVEV